MNQCRYCRFWTGERGQPEQTGECRRTAVPGVMISISEREKEAHWAVWTLTRAEHGCGDQRDIEEGDF